MQIPARLSSLLPLVTVGLFLSVGCQRHELRSPDSGSFTHQISFEKFQLDNGLTVILHEDHRLPVVAVNLWVYVGAKDEAVGRSGFAHLFEHLMFMGTERVPEGTFDQIIESAGGTNNASTSPDRTNYYEQGPRTLLKTFLFLEADRMRTLGHDMTQEKLDLQREVVRNERRQVYEMRPYGRAFLEIWPNMYPEGHPYHHPVIGSHEDLENASIEDVKDFFSRFYLPSNATLVIAGDFGRSEARQWVEEYFGDIPGGPPTPAVTAQRIELKSDVERTLTDSVALPRVQFIYHSPASYRDGDADLDVAAYILGGGKSSRLYRQLVYEKKLAQSVRASQWSSLLGSLLVVEATAQPNVRLEELENEMHVALGEFLSRPPTDREIQRARNQIETAFWHQIEPLTGRADLLNGYQFFFGDPGALQKDILRYQTVTSESVRKWAAEVVGAKKLVIRVLPEEMAQESP